MELKFSIYPQLVFYNSLIKGDKTRGWVKVQNRLWEKHREPYEYLKGDFTKAFLKRGLTTVGESLEELVADGMNTKEFEEILKESRKYKERVKNEWNEKKKLITKELTDILGIELPSDEFEVMITSPKSKAGYYLGDHRIVFGRSEDWANYTLVYLMHECLHEILGMDKITHAVIELAADNELRIRLNKGDVYFKANGYSVGHNKLRILEENMLEDWKEYINNSDTDIFEFIREQKNILAS